MPEIKRQRVLLFIGAGASIPAGLYSVIGLVDQFRKWLQSEGKIDYLEIMEKIIATLQKWNDRGDKNEIDIELLLETIEKIENRDNEVLPLFMKRTHLLSPIVMVMD